MVVRQLIVTKSIIIILLVTSLFSCKDNTCAIASNETKYTEEIIVYLVDQFSKPIPPPPKSLESNEILFAGNPHTFFSVGLKRVMQPISSEYATRIKEMLQDIDTTFRIDYEQDKKIGIELDRLKKDGKYVTRYVKNDEKNLHEIVDIIYDLSTINFNKDYTKAILIMGMSRGKLNGFADILVLEKIEGKWKIIHRKNLVIS